MPPPTSPTILIVDDDLGLLRLIARTLQRENFLTLTASSGREALACLAAHQPDLLVLDLQLADMAGRAVIHELQQAGRLIPFLIITGQGDERTAVEMMKRGALDYLVKDIQFIEFVPTVVRRALDQVARERQLVAAQAELKDSREQLLAISEREQARIGAELHDGLGQQLTAIELRCESLLADLPPRRPDLKQQLSEIGGYLREAVSQTRAFARGLSPVNLGSGGLPEALAELAVRMSRDGKVRCTFAGPPESAAVDPLVGAHLFRIAQEAINNAVKHSGATNICVCLTCPDNALQLTITDNGRGLPAMPSPAAGIGLQIMRHRASVIGADLEIKSPPGQGVAIFCTLPLCQS